MGIFDKEKAVTRPELRSALRKDPGILKGEGKKYDIGQRERMAKDTFGLKYGSEIDKNDYRRVIRELQNQKSRAKDLHDKEALDHKIRYLKQLAGRGL